MAPSPRDSCQEYLREWRRRNLRERGATLEVTNIIAGSSKFRGLSWHSQHRKWHVRISGPKGDVHLGYVRDEAEAARLYDRVKYRVTGSRDGLNYPDHEQLARVEVDGVPADPFSSEEERA